MPAMKMFIVLYLFSADCCLGSRWLAVTIFYMRGMGGAHLLHTFSYGVSSASGVCQEKHGYHVLVVSGANGSCRQIHAQGKKEGVHALVVLSTWRDRQQGGSNSGLAPMDGHQT